jgi:predicted MFS family arabinose efflux permease
MSAKASVKLFMPKEIDQTATSNTLFKWVALLTGSKNTLKGVGFFLGAFLLAIYGFQMALTVLAGGLLIAFLFTFFLLPNNLGKAESKAKFSQLFAHDSTINRLSGARFFLFGSRDVWFVVGLPIYLTATLNWHFETIGSFFALWIIGYGIIQAITPRLLKHRTPDGQLTQRFSFGLLLIPIGIVFSLYQGLNPHWVIIIGLSLFAFLFAINSAIHSFLVIEYSDHKKVAMNVGFYYMANSGGRLTGTVLSGLLFQHYGLTGCLIASSLFIAITTLLSQKLPVATGA